MYFITLTFLVVGAVGGTTASAPRGEVLVGPYQTEADCEVHRRNMSVYFRQVVGDTVVVMCEERP